LVQISVCLSCWYRLGRAVGRAAGWDLVEGLGPRLWKSEQADEQRKGPRFISSHLAKWWARKVYQQLIKLDPRRAFLLPLVLEAAFQSSFFQGMTVRQESRSGWEWYIDYIEEI
jgi:hypothetical protein